MSGFFIRRPTFAIVLSLALLLAGLAAAFRLPVAQYPSIAPPIVTVGTSYTGADAATVGDAVAQIIEQRVNGVQDMDYMTSIADDAGHYQLTVFFRLGTDGDMNAVKVQNNVALASAELPAEVQSKGVTTKKASADTALMVFLYAPDGRYDTPFLRNYADIYLIDRIKRVPGVGDIQLWGADYTMRVWLSPEKLAARSLTVEDAASAIRRQNRKAPAGTVGAAPMPAAQEKQYGGRIEGRLSTPEEFGAIVLRRNSEGGLVRLRDVARIETGLRSGDVSSKVDGAAGAGFGVQLTNNANAVETVDAIQAILAEAEPTLPPGMECRAVVDNTRFIRAALREVAYTFAEALLLVVLVLFLFLQNVRTSLIPVLAIPVSLAGTLGAFVLLGFSLNTITLFAMVLAIGVVVDDVIVVIENVEQHMARGYGAREAAERAMAEVEGPVVATTFVLAAVFLPSACLSGITGLLYKEFSLTIVVATAISTFAALTLTPALCVLLLRPKATRMRSGGFSGACFERLERMFSYVRRGFLKGAVRVLRRARLVLLSLALLCGTTWLLYRHLPSTFVPAEDMGYFSVALYLPEGSAVHRTRRSIDRVADAVRQIPGVRHTVAHAGSDLLSSGTKSNAATMFVCLAPWAERPGADETTAALLRRALAAGRAAAPEAQIMAFLPPALPGLGRIDGWTMQLQDLAGRDDEALDAAANKLVAALEQRPDLQGVRTTFDIRDPLFRFEVDRDKANTLGLDLSEVFTAMQVNFGGYEINDFTQFGRSYKVMLESDAPYRGDVNALRFLFAKNDQGAMTPLDTLLRPRRATGASVLSRFNGVRSVTVQGAAAPGVSSGTAIAAAETAARETLPEGFAVDWAGQSREEKKAAGDTPKLFAFAFVSAFLCLAALYESWSLPFAVLLGVPAGIFGALFSEWALGALTALLGRANPGFVNSVYMQIGVVIIIGLVAKNAILLVEFAKAQTDGGTPALRAALRAAALRFRPILMTAATSIIGGLPLVFAAGAGAAARNGMGAAICGGMLFATVSGLLLTPLLFVLMEKTRGYVSALRRYKRN